MGNESAKRPGEEAEIESLVQAPHALARSQEPAPRFLKKTAVLLVWGSLLPWSGDASWESLLNKCYVLVGSSLILSGVYARHEQRVQLTWFRRPLFAGRRDRLGTFTGFHLLGALTIAWGVGKQVRQGPNWMVLAEFATLLLGTLTYVHIAGYQKGGKFNPLYPLMFGACAIGGVFAMSGRVRAQEWLAAAGCAIITLAGVLAVFTIVVAMLRAKQAGDLEQLAALQAREQARGSAKAAAAGRDSTR